MVKAKIKDIDCSDKPDFRTWLPTSPAEVFIPLTLSIGTTDSPGADLFSIVIATSQGMQGKSKQQYRKIMVVQGYKWSEIEATLNSWVENATGVSWSQITDELRKRFAWEYEGMGPPVLRDPGK